MLEFSCKARLHHDCDSTQKDLCTTLASSLTLVHGMALGVAPETNVPSGGHNMTSQNN